MKYAIVLENGHYFVKNDTDNKVLYNLSFLIDSSNTDRETEFLEEVKKMRSGVSKHYIYEENDFTLEIKENKVEIVNDNIMDTTSNRDILTTQDFMEIIASAINFKQNNKVWSYGVFLL